MLIKIPTKKIGKNTNTIQDIIKKKLEENKENAYTINGLLIECFNIQEKELKGKFKDMNKKTLQLYHKTSTALRKLKEENKIRKTKHEKNWIYYWNDKTKNCKK